MITLLLTKLPWLSTAWGFLKKKRRLVIEYVLIAIVVAVAGFTFSMWLSKERTEKSLLTTENELQAVRQRLGAVESVNQQQEATIGELKELRLQDAQAFAGLLADYKVLADNDARARKRLATLEKSNETVRNYLNEPIPFELVCLLNRTCDTGNSGSDKGGTGSTSRGADAAVPAGSGSSAGSDKRPH
jgi:type II secretory pathway pseudopilin PulG